MSRRLLSVTAVAGLAAVVGLLGTRAAVAEVAGPPTSVLTDTARSSALGAGQRLSVGQSLLSPAGGLTLVMQSDGNLVEYLTSAGRAVWSSRTSCSTTAYFAVQTDNNAVVYCGQAATFSTGTRDTAVAAGGLYLSDNGAIDVGGGFPGPQWHNGVGIGDGVLGQLTSPDGTRQFAMQADGNLVLYSSVGGQHAVWSSQTSGHPGSVAIAQNDGNLVLYDRAGRATWATHTAATASYPDFALTGQDDGNVVLYQQGTHTGPTRVGWQTGTAGRS